MTSTRVVNVRSGIPFDVYVGRPGHGEEGWLGNPFTNLPKSEAIKRFDEDFHHRLVSSLAFKARVDGLLKLRSNPLTLACFCAPGLSFLTAADKPFICHGQVIAEYLDDRRGQK